MKTKSTKSKTMEITKGEWKIQPCHEGLEISNSKIAIARLPLGIKESLSEEVKANGKLIIEAGNVTNECGMTPRELLEQRNELLKALKESNTDLAILKNHVSKELESGRHLWEGTPSVIDERIKSNKQALENCQVKETVK